MCSKEIRCKKVTYVSVLVCMLVLMAIFLNSFYWPYEGISKRKLLVFGIAFFGVVIFPIVCIKIKVIYTFVTKILENICTTLENIRQDKKRIMILLATCILGVAISWICSWILCTFVLHKSFCMHLFYFVLSICAVIVLIVFTWKTASQKANKIFVCLALIMGCFCIGVTPNRVGVSWDDEIHFARTLEISNIFNGIMFEADLKNIAEYADNIYARNGYDRESDEQYQEQLRQVYESEEWSAHQFSQYGFYSVAYIPSAIGIILARGLGLSYAGVFNAGRLFNLLMYVLLISLAMKKIKHGKILIAAIGLIPTTIFMAASYSYDPWVTGFTILGFSYFFSALQEEKTLETKEIIIMLGSFAIGCLPKAIYFPVLFPLLFMPKRKFKDEKHRRMYYVAVIGVGVFLVATFLLPMLVNGAGTGDARGGADVNSTEQIKFILNNPIAYLKILTKFELEYIALPSSASMLQRFAYVGNGGFYSAISLMFPVLAFMDRGQNEKNYAGIRFAGVFACAIAIILSTTALYISFTAVGLETVSGMQARYMIPTIFPALYLLGRGGVTHKLNKNAFVFVPMLMIAFSFIYNMFQLCVFYY